MAYPKKRIINLGLCFIVISMQLNAYVLQEANPSPKYTDTLIDQTCMKTMLTRCKWLASHDATKPNFLGSGMLYYTIAYMKKAEVCVCLGSGGGFVPKCMRQAQRDVGSTSSRTILVDGNMGEYGTPNWLSPYSYFRRSYSDIKIIIDTTANIALEKKDDWKIDYLHIDADHSLEGCMADFHDYLPMMSENGVITIHDTGIKRGGCECRFSVPALRAEGYNVVNFFDMGAGVAVIQLGDVNDL